ncbi:MAG TPA: hypothetical protein VNH18_19805, partial [Bryobacteraceae bacterium]|nr:hypothetical protein [Bryobacteraceae bacterium]
DTPVLSGQTVAIPPANQVAASGSAGSGTSGSGQGARSRQPGSLTGAGQFGADNNTVSQAGGPNRGAGIPGVGEGVSQWLGSAAAGPTASAAGRSSGNGSNGLNGTGMELPLPGTTRLNFPKDDKFGLVVTGSSLAAPYAESNGALSGKIIYSVFVSVGLRKKWILQYCLVKAEEQKTLIKGGAQPVEAPWPYKIVRPDDLGNSNRDYVIVHGILNSDGHFEQLALLFPMELARKDLLMNSLKQWTFRPAARDGVPSDIEILLIIPGQAD